MMSNDTFRLGTLKLGSRLLLGTGRYSSLEMMQKCHHVAKTEMVTVALRRMPLGPDKHTVTNSILNFIDRKKIHLLPNTSGTHKAEEAMHLVDLVSSLGIRFVKLEIIFDNRTLLPDIYETLKALHLIRKKYNSEQMFVMVYTNDDPVAAMKLYDAGADSIMPGGSPIGSGRGIQNKGNIQIILEMLHGKVPLILDAGIGSPADVVLAMEMGFDAVLLNSSIAMARDPVSMGSAMYHAVVAGRLSYASGRISKKLYGTASSPVE